MSEFDRYLGEALADRARDVQVPPGNARRAMARGRSRRRRTNAVVAGVAFTAGAGLVSSLLVLTGGGGHRTKVDFASTPSSAPANPAPQLTWRLAPATSGLTMASGEALSGSALYAVSTGPGTVAGAGSETNALYRSADGATWKMLLSAAGRSVSLADVAAAGNALYAVGTGQATRSIYVDVASSSDAGGSFQNAALPLSLTAPGGSLTVEGLSPKMAAGPAGVVVAVQAALKFDPFQVEPRAPRGSAWAATSTGVEMLGAARPGACPSGSSLTPPSPEVQAGAKGAVPEPTTLAPGAGRQAGAGPGQIVSANCFSGGGRVVASVPVVSAYQVLATYTWSTLGVSPDAAAALQGEPIVYYSSDGRVFRQVASPALADSGLNVAAGPSGFAVAGDNGVIISTDGRAWSPVVPLPSGSEGTWGAGYVGRTLVVVAATASGTDAYALTGSTWAASTLPAQVDSASFGPLGAAAVGIKEPAPGPSGPRWDVLYSADGTHWTAADLARLSKGPVGQASVVVGPSSVVVTVTRPPTTASPSAPAAQVALIGTP